MLVVLAALASPVRAAAFGWDDVVARARDLAREAFYAGDAEIPDWLAAISYDEWRDIRFRPEYATWREEELPFQVQFFHPGLFYNRPVKVSVIDGEEVSPAMFLPSQFDYGRNEFASRVPQTLGYAGFRVHAPIKSSDYFDEVIVFLGASYFRAVGRDQVFGLSARGLAIDTAEPSGEEFPFFREFWIEKPAQGAESLTVFALLDSPGIAGAYGFVVRPGEETDVEVYAELFPRRDIEKLGIAPLTSMFFHGENTERKFDDFRPEAHDSDGLSIHFASGDWLWRPLDNPERLQISRFDMDDPRGFGLIQRDRDFASYQDLETQAQLRPSAWIEPIGAWGAGRVELVEIPTKSDTNDNVVAFWVPARPVKQGEPLAVAYRLRWYGDHPDRPPLARVTATRRDHGAKGDAERFVVDFAGGNIDLIPATEILHGSLSIRPEKEAELVGQQVVKNRVTGEWRLTFQVRPRGSEPVDLRARLEWIGQPLTEIWAYTLMP
ncbi:MAG: glucan biosynthesis protein G [Thermodesulfobacteriota bacterium]